jgi:hypothetical protein
VRRQREIGGKSRETFNRAETITCNTRHWSDPTDSGVSRYRKGPAALLTGGAFFVPNARQNWSH